jgi:hypothetical protein
MCAYLSADVGVGVNKQVCISVCRCLVHGNETWATMNQAKNASHVSQGWAYCNSQESMEYAPRTCFHADCRYSCSFQIMKTHLKASASLAAPGLSVATRYSYMRLLKGKMEVVAPISAPCVCTLYVF